MPIGLAVSFFLIAPEKFLGFNLGAMGLAYQMLLIQILSVNTLSFVNSSFLKISFLKLLLYQVGVFLIFILIGEGCNYLTSFFILNKASKFFLFSLETSIIGLTLVFFFPILIGFKRRDELIQLVGLEKYFLK